VLPNLKLPSVFGIICVMCLICSLSAQSLGPFVISSTGHLLQNDEVMLYGSLGEPISASSSSEDLILSQGLLYALLPEEIVADCSRQSGEIFFETCDNGELFFFIRTDDGTIYDPYYAKSVAFDHQDGQVVDFDFVEAGFESPCSIAAQAITITCVEDALQTSSVDPRLEKGITIYPNPASDVLTVRLSDEVRQIASSVKVFDMYGRCLIDQPSSSNIEVAFGVHLFPQGIYLARVETTEGAVVNKFTIKR